MTLGFSDIKLRNEEAFATCKNTINWAETAIAELQDSTKRFFNNDPVEVVTEFDVKTTENILKVRLRQSLPTEFARKVTEALTNTRHSFDQALYAASNILAPNIRKSIYYPWSQSPTDLKHLLKNRKVDMRLWSTIEAHEPYPISHGHSGGDDLTRRLASLANDKHTVGLYVNNHITETGYPSIKGGPVQSLSLLHPVWDPVKNEAELVRYIGNIEIGPHCRFQFETILTSPRLLAPVNADYALKTFVTKARVVIESLQAKCDEIICDPSNRRAG